MKILVQNKSLSVGLGVLLVIGIFFAYNFVIRRIDKAQIGTSNYLKCLGLKSWANERDVLKVMGAPNEIYIVDSGEQEGKRVLLYNNPSGMDDDNRIYVDTTTFRVLLVYCSNVKIE